MNRFLIYLMAICSFAACKDKQPMQEDVVSNEMNQTDNSIDSTKIGDKNILCFGNSLTAGYGLDNPDKDAWPHLLQARIDSLGLNYRVINAGLSGETSSGGLNRIDWVLSQELDIFILELGANDMLRGIDVESTQQNLDMILQKVQSKYPDASIVIAGMLSPPNMGKEYEASFNQIFPTLAKKYKAQLIPFFLEDVIEREDLMQADEKHPNARGQKLLLENVWKVLKEIL